MMKRALLAAAALLSSTIISTPAFADTITPPTADAANQTTLDAMQTQCDALAALHGPATGPNDHWTGEVVVGAVTLTAGPTEVDGTRVIDESSIQGTGTYVPGALYIKGDPYKNGGSVNLFGEQWSSAGYYPDSTYNFTADFNSTFSHAFSCDIYQEVYHPAVEGHPIEGHYTNPGEGDCNGITNSNPHWGEDIGACIWNYDGPATEDEPESWDDPALFGNEPGVAVTQDQTDNLDGFEDHGGQVQVTGEYFVGDTVICISPSTPAKKGVPGAWVAKNGYGGGSLTGPAAGCNTPYFKIAPTGHGTTTSQGTFKSVPDYNL